MIAFNYLFHYLLTYIHMWGGRRHMCLSMYADANIHLYIYTYMYIHLYLCIYVYIYIYTHTVFYLYLYVSNAPSRKVTEDVYIY